MYANRRKKIRKFDKRNGIKSISSTQLKRDVKRDEIKSGKSAKKAEYIAGAVVGERYREKLKKVGIK